MERPPRTPNMCKLDHLECKNRCASKVDGDTQTKIFQDFWKLTAQQKAFYYQKTIQSTTFKGTRNTCNSYYVEVNSKPIQVCKEFYRCVHGISHTPINTYLKNQDENGIPTPREVHSPSTKYGEEVVNTIREHINSFPRVQSHYCRANTQREYLESSLTLSKMYKLFRNKMVGIGEERIPSQWKYDEIFNREFNIGFHKPKKDRCDKCEKWSMMATSSMMTDREAKLKEAHDKSRRETRKAQHADLENKEETTLLVSFDMENMFELPRMSVSMAYYKAKLNTYNMTAVVNKTKKGYCAVWPESVMGRSGNEVASALFQLLKQIVSDHTEAQHVILWSDSCIPQNRNSIMSYALQYFLEITPQIETITQKFCEPGHSDIQDVDNLHSQISRSLTDDLEIHSPVSLVGFFRSLQPSGKSMYVKDMRVRDFFEFSAVSRVGHYSQLKYKMAKEIGYNSATLETLCYKTSFAQKKLKEVEVLHRKTLRSGQQKLLITPKTPTVLGYLPKQKVEDLRSLLIYMGGQDLEYMSEILKKSSTS